jgi:mycothiol synthase
MSASPLPSAPEAWFTRLIERSKGVDGQPPFSDQSLVDLRSGERDLLAIGELAAAIVAPGEAELVVDPDARGRGHGTALLEAVIARSGSGLLIWAHGDHPAARTLAAKYGFEPVRRLLQLRVPVAEPVEASAASSVTSTSSVTAFRPGIDDAAWIAVNARAFASHPEQGSITQHDLDAIMAEQWFDASAFLLAWDGDRLAGFCWLKIDTPSTSSGTVGELYAVGVDPDFQGTGLGRRLVDAGLAELEARGIRESSLYVEADNVPAVRLYESFGYAEYSVDIQYALTRFTAR